MTHSPFFKLAFLIITLFVSGSTAMAASPAAHNKDFILGNIDAPITIIEYASLSCSHCAHFHNDIFPALKERYIETGKVQFIFRNFPLNEPALRGAMLSECSGKDRFHSFISVLFQTQKNWAGSKDFIEKLRNIGKLGGISGEQADQCMTDTALQDTILKRRMEASTLYEVNSTPTFFINGKKHSGSNDIEYFSGIIDDILEETVK